MTQAAGDLAATLAALQASVPALLREKPQWLLWRFERYDGDKKPRKVPYWVSGRKRSGVQGGADDRAELQTFDIAMTHLARGQHDGLGFAFLPDDGLIGIDIDGAIDDDGVVSERCSSIISACASYTELSPSGHGVHIFVAGQCKTEKDNSIGLEVFCGSQFFTFTGKRWQSAPEQVAPIEEATLRRLIATVRAAKKAGKAKTAPAVSGVGAAATAPGNDFARVNACALAMLDAWVPSLFPGAKRQGTGAWRVSSRELGRSLEEDLSLHSSGINDFGEEQGLTAIDVVVKFAGKTPADALHWLAGAIGVQVAELPKKGQGKAKAKPAAGRATGATSTPSAGSAKDGGSPQADPGGEAPPDEPAPWRKTLLRTSEGGTKDCRENVFTLLHNHPKLQGLVGYDEFAHRVMKLRKPLWDSLEGEWTTNDDYQLGFWLAQHERLTVKAEGTLVAGVAMAAFARRYHPVNQYLDALPVWDNVERLAHWMHECLGAEDSTYTHLVGAWFVMGMVHRVRQPGCQMDYMVVLEGLQGKRKSTAFRVLAVKDDWFADTPMRLGDKDAMLSLAGKWLYEVGELDSFNKAEVTAVKQYVSSRIDRVREPFARRPSDRPRSGVFGGTTNQTEYFKDPTGARRFWPVSCDGAIDLERLLKWRDQLFAEALVRLASADPERRRCWPTRAEEELYLVPQQERREIVDPWFERIALWMDSRQNYGESGVEVREVESFTSFELLTKCLMVPQDRIDGGRQMATRVGIAMHKLGWDKRRDSAGGRVWRYWRPQAKPAAQTGQVDGSSGSPGGPGEGVNPVAEVLHEF